MAKCLFRIEYIDPDIDLETPQVVEKEFSDDGSISASVWAEDWAYTVADKHWHKVTYLKDLEP